MMIICGYCGKSAKQFESKNGFLVAICDTPNCKGNHLADHTVKNKNNYRAIDDDWEVSKDGK